MSKVKLNHVLSPMSNLVLMIYGALGMILIFRPSVSQFLTLFLVDTVAMVIGMSLEWRWFRKRNPALAKYFPELSVDQLGSEPATELSEVVNALYRFPRNRTIYLNSVNFAKVLPATLVVLFLFDQGTVFWRGAKFFLFELTFFTAFAAINCFETHSKVSEILKRVYSGTEHKRVLLDISAADSGNSLLRMETMAHLALLVFGVALLCLQILVPEEELGVLQVARLVTILCLGFLVNARIYFLSREALFSGISQVMQSMKGVDLTKETPLLSLHTSQELNSMERAFNAMSIRLRENQAELSEWIQYESDQNRYRTLGEVAGLVVHDLGTPLHVIRYCVDELFKASAGGSENPLKPRVERSLEKAMSLIESLRAYLKDGHRGRHSVDFKEAHPYVLRVLSVEFGRSLGDHMLESVITADAEVMKLKFACARLDLIQILDNLYRNALQNMLENRVSDVSIRVSLLGGSDERPGTATLRFEDVGSGLTQEAFEAMTSARVGKGGFKKNAAEKGLGLRLTRRLVEHLGGKLEVTSEVRSRGACMLLTLPVLLKDEPDLDERVRKEA
jgi:signal transduction histidine kinase